ncbi:hypothetical protein [Nocardia sputorum]|uniref:Uncharacterized protein n=1 Tax=Nocardia sputorum TaxID=2984338 RepID=A0ABM8D4X8_9NOCA|nr:hypothetical protein [Nocardia sputorum]BDU02467.1 hypothetical protein IFM12276_54950 [Nocardia sputorum]
MTRPGGQATGDEPAGAGDATETHPKLSADEAEQAEATASGAEEPDVGFTLSDAAPVEDVAERAKALMRQVARELGAGGPPGWQRVDAVFTLTVAAEVAVAVYSDERERTVRVTPDPGIVALVREHRQLAAGFGDGPYWRLLFTVTSAGRMEVDYDYGDEPFPDDQLFPPEVYLADLAAFPRESLPVWLGAYVGHGDRQLRPPQVAAARARADREAGVRAVPCEDELPPFPLMAARWAVLAAAFVAAGSQWGPRLLPSVSWFEGAKRSGCSLYALPGGRAVLSGGVWNAPELAAAYNDGARLPDLYAGAPEWVAGQVLNHRCASGLLSFCYWWENGRWYRGESPGPDRFAEAVPGVWTAAVVVDIVSGLLGDDVDAQRRAAVDALVSAAEAGVVTRDALADVFGDDDLFDVDGAFFQLTMAGVTTTAPGPMPREEAIALVERFIRDSGAATVSYPLEDLRADRLDVGWMVYVPVEPGEIAIGRAIYYIADDGVLERSSSSVAPSVYIGEFERRFRDRHGPVGASWPQREKP